MCIVTVVAIPVKSDENVVVKLVHPIIMELEILHRRGAMISYFVLFTVRALVQLLLNLLEAGKRLLNCARGCFFLFKTCLNYG